MLKLMWATSLSDCLCSHVIRNTSSKVRNRREWRSGAVPDRCELGTVPTARQGPEAYRRGVRRDGSSLAD